MSEASFPRRNSPRPAPRAAEDVDGSTFMLRRNWITLDQVHELKLIMSRGVVDRPALPDRAQPGADPPPAAKPTPSERCDAPVKTSSRSASADTDDLDPSSGRKRLSGKDVLAGSRVAVASVAAPHRSGNSVTEVDGVCPRVDVLHGTVDFAPPDSVHQSASALSAGEAIEKAGADPNEKVDAHTKTQVEDCEKIAPHDAPDHAGQRAVENGDRYKPARQISLDTVDFKSESRSHYTLSRVHGKGGLGQVWLAIDRQLNREVALKELHPDKGASTDISARFIKEAQVTGQLEHPNIIASVASGSAARSAAARRSNRLHTTFIERFRFGRDPHQPDRAAAPVGRHDFRFGRGERSRVGHPSHDGRRQPAWQVECRARRLHSTTHADHDRHAHSRLWRRPHGRLGRLADGFCERRLPQRTRRGRRRAVMRQSIAIVGTGAFTRQNCTSPALPPCDEQTAIEAPSGARLMPRINEEWFSLPTSMRVSMSQIRSDLS